MKCCRQHEDGDLNITWLVEVEGASLLISLHFLLPLQRLIAFQDLGGEIDLSALFVKFSYVAEFKFASHSVRPYASDSITSRLPLIRRWNCKHIYREGGGGQETMFNTGISETSNNYRYSEI